MEAWGKLLNISVPSMLLWNYSRFDHITPSRRTKSKMAAAAKEPDSGDAASETDEPAPTSDVEIPDVEDESDKEGGKSAHRQKTSTSKKGKKRKGGVIIPDEWPWEEAKKIFVNPEVLPADELEVNVVSHNLKPAY